MRARYPSFWIGLFSVLLCACTTAAPKSVQTRTPQSSTKVLTSCFPSLTWTDDGDRFFASNTFPGNESFDIWSKGQTCAMTNGYTPLLLGGDSVTIFGDPDSPTYKMFATCRPSKEVNLTWSDIVRERSIPPEIRRELEDYSDPESRADYGEEFARIGRSRTAPYLEDKGSLLGETTGEYEIMRLLLIPKTAQEILGCLPTISDKNESFSDSSEEEIYLSFFVRWHERWGAIPYSVVGGEITLYVPSPPTVLSDVLIVALEHARLDPNFGTWGNEEYMKQAASHFWMHQ